jgi:hypothetical protein
MTTEELDEKLQVLGSFEFKFKEKIYIVDYDKNAPDTKKYHLHRRDVSGQYFEDFKALMAFAKIENYFLREILSDL